ncbi:hypothetical protein [Pseudomonas rubra]|uniref:PGAP1-like protein n=1 Tax=Pseudomonas rubra TaxID=2942627 RepID=A0ABT5PG06_9PSED|nr:hypothetical protein [Pseudomonas rubra]MDD1017249.1 hypothetical protein [Pseudomonas rubra]MDD1041706.1 hypothetical protein [Pseudomonas rubra]MDD1156811.1 hypothetical protein [Pseudomonas rubra]
MSILTVYFCGTGSHRFDDKNPNFWNGELVSTLAANDQGKEFAHWVAIDGPGSGNLQADDLFIKTKAYGLSGTLFGKGWEENVSHALHVIKGSFAWRRKVLNEAEYKQLKAAGIPIEDVEKTGSWFWRTYSYGNRVVTPQQLQEQIIKMFRKNGPLPTQVNLVGWSRGGVSCHMLANAMLGDSSLKHIPVNIFAIDPVPGLLNFQAHRVQLGDNIKQYVGFYSRDERSKGFACVVPRTHGSTRCHIYPMPGRHATLVGNASADGAGAGKVLIEPGLIVRHFAEVCLSRWGVKLQKMLNLSDQALAQYHQALVRDEGRYQAMRGYSYTVLTESDKSERAVSLGSEGRAFTRVSGAAFAPDRGLAAAVRWEAGAYKEIR